MSTEDTKVEIPSEADVQAWLAQIDGRVAFGPAFFLTHLRAFVRDRCPDRSEGLPVVELHLETGETLDVCHVIGLANSWAALAVREGGGGAMRTELVPYRTIHRVTVRAGAPGPHIGFEQDHVPHLLKQAEMLSPEQALQIAARADEKGAAS
jgi:hypothetical protein